MKTFFYKRSNSGRNESTLQTQNNVSWISSKADLKISFLNSRLEVPIPAVASASVLHSAAVGGSVVGVVRPL